MKLNDLLSYMQENDLYSAYVHLFVYPNKQYVMMPFYTNDKVRDYVNRGILNFKIKGNFETESQDDFYHNISLCMQKVLQLDGEPLEIEHMVKTTTTSTKFEREYKRNINDNYHYLCLHYTNKKPDWCELNEELNAIMKKLTVSEMFPYYKSGGWGGNYDFVIQKENVEQFLYEDIISLISNKNPLLYADKILPNTQTINQ